MSTIFNPLVMRGKTLPNRFFAQAMEGNDGEDGGRPSERTINRYIELAKGNWGAIQVEATSVVETSLARKNGMLINKKNIDGFKRLVESFKKHNDSCPILLQLTHSGERSGGFSERVTITPKNCSSKQEGEADNEDCRYLSSDEIETIKEKFVEAALLAEEAGMDGIDFKMCHGYFGGELLRPANLRNDKWGGSFENRTRFLREAIGEIKAGSSSAGFILGSRFSIYEGIRGGCGSSGPDEITEDISEMLELVRVIDSLGMDFVNVSAGIPALTAAITRPMETSKLLALHHLRYTKAVKELIKSENRSIKVIGSAYSTFKKDSVTIMEEMLSKNYVDLCGFGRQVFADPMTPAKIAANEKVDWCLLCAGCSKLMAAQLNDGCIVYNGYYKELNRTKTPASL